MDGQFPQDYRFTLMMNAKQHPTLVQVFPSITSSHLVSRHGEHDVELLRLPTRLQPE